MTVSAEDAAAACPHEARLAYLHCAFDRCKQRAPLKGLRVDRITSLGAVFADRCSPSDASRLELRVVARFLYAILGLNELQRSRPQDYYAAVDAFFASYQGRAPTDVWSALGFGLRHLLILHRPSTCRSSFTHALWETLGASLWEVEPSPCWPRTESDYALLRERTIGVQPFLELWKLLRGLSAKQLMPFAAPLARVEWLSRRVQYLDNDLGSRLRDQHSHHPNAITILATRRALSQRAAEEAIEKQRDDAHATLIQLMGQLASSSRCSEECRLYLDLVRRCTAGNSEAMRELFDHYCPHSSANSSLHDSHRYGTELC